MVHEENYVSVLSHYSRNFEQQVRGLCAKYYDEIADPIFEYDDLKQEAEILMFELEIFKADKFKGMFPGDVEKYLFSAIKYHFMSLKEKSNNRNKAEDTYFDA